MRVHNKKLPLSKYIKIIAEFRRLIGDLAFTNFIAQKRRPN